MLKKWSFAQTALVVALSLCFSSEALSRPVAILPSIDGQYVIVLTDDFTDACPVETNAALVYSVKDETFDSTVLGCWAHDKSNDTIGIVWMSTKGTETFEFTREASAFTVLEEPATPL